VQALGIFISYNKQENNKKNVVNKIDNLNIKLDLWRGCNLSLFGKCLNVKSLGISQIVYSASMLDTFLFYFLISIKKENKYKCKLIRW